LFDFLQLQVLEVHANYNKISYSTIVCKILSKKSICYVIGIEHL